MFRGRLLDAAMAMNHYPESWDAERSTQVAGALRRDGRLRLRVRGESMLPSVWPGDIVEIQQCAIENLRRGDIVLASREGRLFLHRFLGHTDAGGFVLRGDSMPKPDPVYPPDAFLAKMVCARPSPHWWLAVGLVLCYCGVARRLALRIHSRRGLRAEQFDCWQADPGGNA